MSESNDSRGLLDEAIAGVRARPLPDGPSPQLMRQTAAAMRAARTPSRWKSPASLAAAMIAVAIGITWWIGRAQSALAFADIVAQVNQTHCVTWNEPSGAQGHWWVRGARSRWEQYAGAILIDDHSTGQRLLLTPNDHDAQLQRLAPDSNDVYSEIHAMAADQTHSLGEKNFDGVRLTGFSTENVVRDHTGQLLYRQNLNVWVDLATKLPRRIETTRPDTGKVGRIMTDIRFDVPMDDAMFDLTPPKGYTVHSVAGPTMAQLKPPPDAAMIAKLVLRPDEGLGDLKFGASGDDVIAYLGVPEDGTDHITWGYPSLGLEITVDRIYRSNSKPTSRKFAAVAAWDSTRPEVMRTFAGRTDKAIAMGSTREQVEAAYGQPEWGDLCNAHYPKIGMRIIYRGDGKTVDGIILYAPGQFVTPATTSPATRR